MSMMKENEGNYHQAAETSSSKLEVYLRFRPMNRLEISKRSRCCVEFDSPDSKTGFINGLTVDSPLEGEFDFSFNRVSTNNCD